MRKNKIRLFDIAVLLAVVASVSFYDIKILFLSLQALALFFAIPIVIKNKRIKNTIVIKYFLWALLFILYSSLSILWISEENNTAFMTILSIIQVVLLSIVIIIYCDGKQNAVDRTFKYIIAAAGVLVARFILTVPVSQWGNGERFSKDTIFGSNTPAIALAYASVILFWKLIFNHKMKKWKKISCVCLILAFMAIALLMGTKKSILIFVIGSVIVLLLNSKNIVKIIKTLVITMIFILSGYMIIQNTPLLYNSIGYRIDSFIETMTSDDSSSNMQSTAVRRRLLGEAIQVFKDNPVIGVGQDGFRYESSMKGIYSHNNYAELLANLGVIGFAIYYSLYFIIYRGAKGSNYHIIIKVLLPIMLVVDISAITYSSEFEYILFGLLLGAAGVKSEKENEYEIVKEN